MNRITGLASVFLFAELLLAGAGALAQQPTDSSTSSPSPGNPSSTQPNSTRKDPTSQPKSERKSADQVSDDQESSSRDTMIDTSPPKDDAKNHPFSQDAVSDLEAPPPSASNSDVQEFHPWNPYKANKDIQVGDFYFKRKNYKGALGRYQDALYYKQNDAVATFRMGECEEKLGNKAEAKKYFEEYLKILPEGPLAKDAHAQLAKLEKAK
ncbi:MAG: tetratricopeptide repeat protein [Terriglobales bacterium]